MSTHKVKSKKKVKPVHLSKLSPSTGFILHSVLCPEMNSVEAVLSSDSDEVYLVTNISKEEPKEIPGVGKFTMVCGLKTGNIQYMSSTLLVHEVEIDITYSMK